MDVKILGGNGLHASEVRAVQRMKAQLRDSWFAYASLLVADDQGSMDIDTLIITHDRLLLVELKEWNGTLESSDGRWYINGESRGKSPYEIKRVHALRLRKLLQQELEHKLGYFPIVEAHVVLCGSATPDRLGTSERRYVHTLEDFLKVNDRDEYGRLVEDHSNIVRRLFDQQGKPRPNSTSCLPVFKQFFSGSRVRPKEFILHHFVAEQHPWFVHRNRLFIEYKGHHDEATSDVALMRRWDLTQLGVGHATQDQWASIVLREGRVISHAKQHNGALEDYLLRPLVPLGTSDISEDVTEIYELRRSYSRLDEFLNREAKKASQEQRLDWVRALIAPFAELHSLGLGHRDIDLHNLWYASEQKSIVVSGLATAFFPEKGTIGDLREHLQGSSLRLPEDLMRVSGDILDPFRQDVFMLAVAAYRICYPGTKVPEDENGIAQWIETVSDPHEGKLSTWFEKALDYEPEQRFANASEMLASFNQLTSASSEAEEDPSVVIETIFAGDFVRRGWSPFNLTQEFPPLPGEAPNAGVKTAYRCTFKNLKGYCKVWWNITVDRGSPGLNRRIANFRTRIERVIHGQLPTPQVLDYGLLETGGLYVVTELAEGELWSDYVQQSNNKLSLALALLKAVTVCHEQGVNHGDLHPGNLLVAQVPSQDAEDTTLTSPKVFLLDMLDFGGSSEPFNLEYGPRNPAAADAMARDRHAVYKLVRELVGNNVGSTILDELERGLSQPGEIPVALEPLERELEAAIVPDDKLAVAPSEPLTLSWHSTNFPETPLTIESDGGVYHFNCQWDKRNSDLLNCYVTGVNASFVVALDPEQRQVRSIRLKSNIPLSDLVSASAKATAHISREIRAIKGGLQPAAAKEWIELLLGLDPVITVLEEKYSSDSDSKSISGGDFQESIPIKKLWRVLLETEQESLLNLEIAPGNIEESRTGRLLIPYRILDDQSMDFGSDELVIAYLDSEDIQIGTIDVLETTPEVLALHPTKANIRKQLRSGGVIKLESVQSKASRDKRVRATERVLDRGSIIPDLANFFDPNIDTKVCSFAEAPSENELRSLYDQPGQMLNGKQIEAFQRLIEQGPIGVLQGPPGTGKTSFVGFFIHYLYSVLKVRNILLVGQSHTAVDAVAMKARKVCFDHGFDISVVRMGQERMIATGMLETHSRAIQRQIRHAFHRQYEQRIRAVAHRFGLPEPLIDEIAIMHRTLAPLLESAQRYRDVVESPRTPSQDETRQEEEATAQLSRVEALIEKILYQRYPDVASHLLSLPDPWSSLLEHVAGTHTINNPAALSRLQGVLDLSHEWLAVLRTGEANYDQFLVQTRQLVCGTLVGMGKKDFGVAEAAFDWVIVDEAARAQASELMISLQSARRVLMVGDHKQLPPHYEKSHLRIASRRLQVDKNILTTTDFERAFQVTGGVTLDTQYRMSKPIGDLVSECFYSDERIELKTGRPASPGWYGELAPPWNSAVIWIDSGAGPEATGDEEIARGKYINRFEVRLIMELLQSLSRKDVVERLRESLAGEYKHAIGVITMYRAQKELIEKELSKAEWAGAIRSLVRIDTVDSYQGQENKVILLSLVRDNIHENEGFMSDKSRINVSISRAQERLVVVGAARMWSRRNHKSALGTVLNFVRQKHQENDTDYRLMSGADLGSTGKRLATEDLPHA